MKDKTPLTAVALVAVLAIAGCKKQENAGAPAGSAVATTGETPNGAVAAGQPSSAQEADAKLGDKLSEYIGCFNSYSESVHSSYNRYFSWVDEKKGLTGKERYPSYGLYQFDGARCFESLDKAKTLPPPLPDVEAAAEAYRTAATELQPLAQAAYKYYDQDDYKDDKFAKGKEMHAPLVAAFKKFFAADDALSGKVVPMNEALSERRLKALETDPNHKTQYLIERSVADAKKLVNLSNVKTLDELDEAKFTAALTTYDTSVTNLETFANANKAEMDKVSMASSLLSDEQNLLKAAKDLGRRKRDKKDFNKEFFSNSSPQMVEGHPAQIIEKFNSLIRTSNNLTYR